MQNKLLLLLLIGLFLTGCNVPSSMMPEVQREASGVLWDLSVPETGGPAEKEPERTDDIPVPTNTPQLYKPVDFEAAFAEGTAAEVYYAAEPQISPAGGDGTDSAQWLYFSPAEYSSGPMDVLYAAFLNNGNSTWTEDYSLVFYAGSNPSKSDGFHPAADTPPGDRLTFEIPVTNQDPSWKSCWQLKNSSGVPFYEFCYNHGNGADSPAPQPAPNVPGNSGNGTFWGFVKTEGTAPERYSDEQFSAEFLSSSPSSGHTFRAYDHSEEISVSFQNTGSAVWDSSWSLVFYSGYNWMHANAFSLPGSVGPGETAAFTLPIEIIEDNDTWFTCWYLSSPDGKNLADFCFNYYTRS